jgi:hypothetical protein
MKNGRITHISSLFRILSRNRKKVMFMQRSLLKSVPIGTNGRECLKDRSGMTEGPMKVMTRIEAMEDKVSRLLAEFRGQKALVERNDPKLAGKGGLALAYAELACSVVEVRELHKDGSEPELVRDALEAIVKSDVPGKEHANPIARAMAEVLLAQIERETPANEVRRMLTANQKTLDGARSRVSGLVLKAQAELRQREALSEPKGFMEETGKALHGAQLQMWLERLVSSHQDIWLLREGGRDDELVRSALAIISGHSRDERAKCGAAIMLKSMGP